MSSSKKKVIIAGAGFAGIQVARNLDASLFDVLILDRLNHHQFQPLFYQVASSQIEPSSISFPIRNIFRGKKNVSVRMAEAISIDNEKKILHSSCGDFDYDFLVLALGCRTNFFGNTELEKHALTLKSTYEAIQIRNHLLETFEKVLYAREEEKTALLNIVIAGAGPTGVELAGAFSEIRDHVLPGDYPGTDFSRLAIILVEGSPNTLNNMSPEAQKASYSYLKELGVDVRTGTLVKSYDGKTLLLSSGEAIQTKTLIWSAGVIANSIAGMPEEARAPGNRIRVDRQSRVTGMNAVFALGDAAFMETPLYPKGHPQVANVAINQAKLLAGNLKSLVLNRPVKDYEYRDLGSMATIGTNKAVVDLPFFRFKGYPAWLVWMFLHLMLILSVKNKLFIFINWAIAYLTRNTSLRLILKNPLPKNPAKN
jgi:NADH dehydrogenase